MRPDVFNVLFLCPDNSARSIIAEVLLNRFGNGRFRAFSAAATWPALEVDPLVIELLEEHSLWKNDFKPKHWKVFCGFSSPSMDYVISLGDLAILDFFPGDPFRASWHISFPASDESDETRRREVLRRAFRELETRIPLFVLVHHDTPAPLPPRKMPTFTEPVAVGS